MYLLIMISKNDSNSMISKYPAGVVGAGCGTCLYIMGDMNPYFDEIDG